MQFPDRDRVSSSCAGIDDALLIGELGSGQTCLVELLAVNRRRRHGHQNSVWIRESLGIRDGRLVGAKGKNGRSAARLNDLLYLDSEWCVNSHAEDVLGRAIIGLRRCEADPRRPAVSGVELQSARDCFPSRKQCCKEPPSSAVRSGCASRGHK